MLKTTLIGDPVEHSVAPILHTEIANFLGMGPSDFAYVKTVVEPEKLAEKLDALELLGFSGGNVTLPIKLDVMKCVEADEAAQFIGAVNTFVFKDGKRYGYNTDWQGVIGALERAGLPKNQRDSFVVLGSGGAARAAIYAARQLQFKNITVFYEEPADKKTANLQGRAEELGIVLHTYDDNLEPVLEGADVIYNTTSTGMTGFAEAPFELSRLQGLDLKGTYVGDAVFHPLQTPLLQAAEQAGAITIDGVWWTVFQGAPSFSCWIGKEVVLPSSELNNIYQQMVKATNELH